MRVTDLSPVLRLKLPRVVILIQILNELVEGLACEVALAGFTEARCHEVHGDLPARALSLRSVFFLRSEACIVALTRKQ